jgi:predicted nucleic acid-binding protein
MFQHSRVVSNTSPLVNLAVIGRLPLLRDQLQQIIVPQTVWDEVSALPDNDGLAALNQARDSGWLIVVPDPPTELCAEILATGLDAGESAAIALAISKGATLLLIDERKGRQEARARGLVMTGVLGILAAACRMGVIDNMRAEMRQLRVKAGFFLSPAVEELALQMSRDSEEKP